MFKRRNRLGFFAAIAGFFYPRGGWIRAYEYVKLRIHRLPGTPEQIARGLFMGVFVCFTPVFGLHILLAMLLAMMVRGSVIAALIGTFLGNPLTYVPIAAVSLGFGNIILGRSGGSKCDETLSLGGQFWQAIVDLWYNFMTIFTNSIADWNSLDCFYNSIFLPYLVGGAIPGLIVSTLTYFISVPVIRSYQNRKQLRIAKRVSILSKSQSAEK